MGSFLIIFLMMCVLLVFSLKRKAHHCRVLFHYQLSATHLRGELVLKGEITACLHFTTRFARHQQVE